MKMEKKRYSLKKIRSGKKPFKSKHKIKAHKTEESREGIRLNRFIANAGVCSRREADELIKKGEITVNSKVITEMGTIVSMKDDVRYNGKKLNAEKKIYLLLNKPKDYVTTVSDPHAKHTVMELIKGACDERIYPVGRLDINTSGLLLCTNDGALANQLMHPRYKFEKEYRITVNGRFDKSN